MDTTITAIESILGYIAANNPTGLQKVLFAHGYPPAATLEELYALSLSLYDTNPAQLEKEFLAVHPDKDLIVQYFETAPAPCSCKDKKDTPQQTNQPQQGFWHSLTNGEKAVVGVAGFFVLLGTFKLIVS